MCIICTDPNCDHGERCGRVKIYKEEVLPAIY